MIDEPPPIANEPAHSGLDVRKEQSNLTPELLEISRDALRLILKYQLEHRALRASDLLVLRAPEERQQVRQLAARFHQQNEDDTRLAPALQNALGKLLAAAGDFDAALTEFQTAPVNISDLSSQSKVFANAYLIALELRQFDDALMNLNRAAARDPEHYAPFPITKYEAEKILRYDGFGVAFLCRHRNAGTNVIVRSLRTDVLERRVDEIFHDAQVLDTLECPAIARLRDCDYADADQTRPYVVHDDFDGVTLAEHLATVGPLSTADLLAVAKQLAETLQAVHGKQLLHASIQPSNVLVRKEEGGWRVKLVNFGLSLKRSVIRDVLDRPDVRSRLILGACVTGTLECAAPEQLGRLDGVPVGPAADVYAFGRICYAALLRTTEPDDQEKEGIDLAWRKLLGQCTAWNITRRLAGFGPVMEKLSQMVATPTVPEIRINPEEAAASVQRGIACRQRGDINQALLEFDRAIACDPESALAFQGRANTYSTRGDFDKAITDYDRAIELDPRLSMSYINRGLAYVKQRQIDKAIADYTKALEIDPKQHLAYLNRGSAYARRGEFDKAIGDFTEALKIDAKLPLAFVNRGLAYSKKGEPERTIVDYNKALELDPRNSEALARGPRPRRRWAAARPSTRRNAAGPCWSRRRRPRRCRRLGLRSPRRRPRPPPPSPGLRRRRP